MTWAGEEVEEVAERVVDEVLLEARVVEVVMMMTGVDERVEEVEVVEGRTVVELDEREELVELELEARVELNVVRVLTLVEVVEAVTVL